MFRLINNKKGQNTAEYAILIGLVVAAVIAMQTYVKRGLQGRMHDASNRFYDEVTKPSNWTGISQTAVTPLASKQYEPEELSSVSTQQTLKGSYEKTDMAVGGTLTRESVQRTQQKKGDYRKYDY
jgi:Flp pilus assembly pilin Flp